MSKGHSLQRPRCAEILPIYGAEIAAPAERGDSCIVTDTWPPDVRDLAREAAGDVESASSYWSGLLAPFVRKEAIGSIVGQPRRTMEQTTPLFTRADS